MEGILPLWKPAGLTSHDCVFKVRKLLHMKKVGHTGTLDPNVTGVLPICLGRATKIAEYITDAGKEYEGEVTVGFSTTTEDSDGDRVSEKKVTTPFSIEEIREVLVSLTGDIEQVPPMYSAVKIKGKKLYEYARKGIEVERPSRMVKIYSLHLKEDSLVFEEGLFRFRFSVSCSKGTYIRTLAVTIGEKLGYPAHMSHLIRTSSASFRKEDCVTLEQLKLLSEDGKAEEAIFPLERGISHLPSLEIDDKLSEKVKNGAVLPLPDRWPGSGTVMVHDGSAIAVYRNHPDKEGIIKPEKVLRNE